MIKIYGKWQIEPEIVLGEKKRWKWLTGSPALTVSI